MYVQRREACTGPVTIYEYERGLLYVRGRFAATLEPGRYRIWPFTQRRIVIVDVRQVALRVPDQKLLTSDHVPVTVTLDAECRMSDPVLALHSVQDLAGTLYAVLQAEARNVIGGMPVNELLAGRESVPHHVLERARPRAAAVGVELATLAVRDVILPPRVRDLLMKEVETRRLAEASLAGAREEVATVRALANAARIIRDHPEILRLRELALARDVAQSGRHTFVLGTSPLGPPAPRTEPETDAID